MTRTTNARIAGITFLVYIAATITSMLLFARATSGAGVTAQLAAYFLKMEASFNSGAFFFAVGSTLFWWLLLRGRMIPILLARLGVLASLLPLVCFPLQIAGLLGGPVTAFMWIPILLLEVALALWLILKGVALPAPWQLA